jgi:hypothetical protein
MHVFICDFLLDIVQNSFEAGAVHVTLVLKESDQFLDCTVKDDGKGMSEEVQKRVLDPFYTDGIKHAKRNVGLGLPFLSQTVLETGGTFDLQSKEGKGTVVRSCSILTRGHPADGGSAGNVASAVQSSRCQGIFRGRSLSTVKGSGSYQVAEGSWSRRWEV